jgi:hypothetical protein
LLAFVEGRAAVAYRLLDSFLRAIALRKKAGPCPQHHRHLLTVEPPLELQHLPQQICSKGIKNTITITQEDDYAIFCDQMERRST